VVLEMAGQLRFKPFKPMKPPPGWKCPKRFKLGLGEPWESKSESGSDGGADVKVRTFVSQWDTSKHSAAWLYVKRLTAQVLKSRGVLQFTHHK